jgi:hypothetical protein
VRGFTPRVTPAPVAAGSPCPGCSASTRRHQDARAGEQVPTGAAVPRPVRWDGPGALHTTALAAGGAPSLWAPRAMPPACAAGTPQRVVVCLQGSRMLDKKETTTAGVTWLRACRGDGAAPLRRQEDVGALRPVGGARFARSGGVAAAAARRPGPGCAWGRVCAWRGPEGPARPGNATGRRRSPAAGPGSGCRLSGDHIPPRRQPREQAAVHHAFHGRAHVFVAL